MKEVTASLFLNEVTGIYESLRAYEGVPFRAEEHLERFFESAKTLGMRMPESPPRLKQRIQKALAESGKRNAFIRLTLIEKIGAHGRAPLLFVTITERTHPPELYKNGVSLKTSTVRRNLSQALFPEAKSTSGCLNQVLATLDPSGPGNYEILFLNQEGYLAEVRIGNIFMVQNGALMTPPPVGLLNGVTRRFVIECALAGKVAVEERPLTRHELFNCEEAFLTNTSWEILPIREVDGRQIGEKIPGLVTKKLQILFSRGVKREIRRFRNAKAKAGASKRIG